MQDGCTQIGSGRPKVSRTCPGCHQTMSAREFHDHSVRECQENARWEAIFRRFEDPHYYDHDERSPVPCSLAIVAHVNQAQRRAA